jgi:hypothetical protein
MSHESEEKRSRGESTFSRILERLSNKTALLDQIEAAAAKLGVKTDELKVKIDVSIAESTGEDDTDKLFFVVDTSDTDEEKLSTLGSELEDILGHPDWIVIRKQSLAPERLNDMFKNLTLLTRANAENIQKFVTETEGPTAKIRK